MQSTNYFKQKRLEPSQMHIKQRWIENTYLSPEFRLLQSDGRVSLFSKVSEMNNQYLRLILLKDGKTVRDAYFDKHFNPRMAARGLRGRRL
ncbi:hypothetical protein KJ365_06540 [Glaciecola sp. XM2]|jgi:hypothetical protein|uniref:hypothetical protein n=1 Tax=Glaciecola sp. XM2 TaxID=1914931 RepID=UPI001BDE9F06|nr:hypothetical protein [Glaciecola sp. XM2]MBT1450536.1 hypothetical protein [Glaciecola sp. XM2]